MLFSLARFLKVVITSSNLIWPFCSVVYKISMSVPSKILSVQIHGYVSALVHPFSVLVYYDCWYLSGWSPDLGSFSQIELETNLAGAGGEECFGHMFWCRWFVSYRISFTVYQQLHLGWNYCFTRIQLMPRLWIIQVNKLLTFT